MYIYINVCTETSFTKLLKTSVTMSKSHPIVSSAVNKSSAFALWNTSLFFADEVKQPQW